VAILGLDTSSDGPQVQVDAMRSIAQYERILGPSKMRLILQIWTGPLEARSLRVATDFAHGP